MELGEKICTPAGTPKCDLCPLREKCVAHRDSLWSVLPKKSPKKERRTEEYTVLLLITDGKVALRKRPKTGLLAGLWEFPSVTGKRTEQEIRDHLVGLGLSPRHVTPIGDATHIFTHITWSMTGFAVECDTPTEEFSWFNPEELRAEIAVPTAFRFYLRQVLGIE